MAGKRRKKADQKAPSKQVQGDQQESVVDKGSKQTKKRGREGEGNGAHADKQTSKSKDVYSINAGVESGEDDGGSYVDNSREQEQGNWDQEEEGKWHWLCDVCYAFSILRLSLSAIALW